MKLKCRGKKSFAPDNFGRIITDKAVIKVNSKFHHRRSIRLKEYDYSRGGAYFITICTNGRKFLFGDVIDSNVSLSKIGNVVEKCWREIPQHFQNTKLDEYIVMPNHVHGIVMINEIETKKGAKDFSPLQKNLCGTEKTVGSIVRGFKIGVTKWVRKYTNIENVWQRNYYEHIIRNEKTLSKIREYIVNNPAQWQFDRENPTGAKDFSPPHKEEPWEV